MTIESLEDYGPYKTYMGLIKYVLQAVNTIDEISDGFTIESLAQLIVEHLHSNDSNIDEIMRRRYYEYQELYFAMEAFLDFYLAGEMTRLESLTRDQQRIRYQAASRTRIHCRNFLTTQKIG